MCACVFSTRGLADQLVSDFMWVLYTLHELFTDSVVAMGYVCADSVA